MKLMKRLSSGLVAMAVVAAFSAQAEQGIAKVVGIKGAARYTTADNSTWRPLKNGTILHQGAVVQTASESHVDLVLNNAKAGAAESAALGQVDPSASGGTSPVSQKQTATKQDAVRIYQNTVLGVDKLSIDQTGVDKVTETQLDLKAGRILGTVKKLSGGSTYEIKIPSGVAGVRGTVYSISADGILSVYSGSVVLAFVGPGGTPTTQEVRAGQRYDAKTGVISTIPESEMNAVNREAGEIGKGLGTVATTFTVDRTVYYVSPTSEQSDE